MKKLLCLSLFQVLFFCGKQEPLGEEEYQKQLQTDAPYIALRWRDNSEIEEGYEIERKAVVLESRFRKVFQVKENVTSWRDYEISDGLLYCYRVRAFKGDEYSEYSEVHCSRMEENSEE